MNESDPTRKFCLEFETIETPDEITNRFALITIIVACISTLAIGANAIFQILK